MDPHNDFDKHDRPLDDIARATNTAYSDLKRQRDLLRVALVKVVGVDGRAELEQLEAAMRRLPAPAEDKAATIDAIHALIATLTGEREGR